LGLKWQVRPKGNENLQEGWEMLLFSQERALRVPGGPRRLLADKLNIDLIGVAAVEVQQFFIAWLLDEFVGDIFALLEAQMIAQRAQIALELLPKQQAKQRYLLFPLK
jgi:hypothetical protein